MTADSTEPTFIRRKFTITEELDDVLTQVAEQNYQGNVSLCIRAAIEDHRSTLDGTDSEQFAAQRLAIRLDEIENQQEEIQTGLESVQEQMQDATSSESGQPSENESGGMTDDMLRVYRSVKAADSGLRIEDLVERLDLSSARLQTSLGSLVDLGYVTKVDDGTARFRLAGYSSQHTSGGRS